MKRIPKIYIATLLVTLASGGCHEEWLDIKQDKKIVVPHSLNDMQALMNNTRVMNISTVPMLGEIGSNDFYLSTEDWSSLSSEEQRNAYIWTKEIYAGGSSGSWNNPYGMVLIANLALEGVEKIEATEQTQVQWNTVKGSALFYRSWAFFQLAQVFSKQYDLATAATDPGIPLRLESDIKLVSRRATVKQTYDRIIEDLKTAQGLLTEEPLFPTNPGKAAVNGLLAKVYLQMGEYSSALEYAEAALNVKDDLMDFNSLDAADNYPFVRMNEEVIFHSTLYSFSATFNAMHIDPELYAMYDENDLRKALYFHEEDGRIEYRGTYDGSSRQFGGIATDELYLIAAECEARAGNISSALAYLNSLLETRWEAGSYVPVETTDEDEALRIILDERRKSLLFRGIRWMDLRRLNKEPAFETTLTRVIDGVTYELKPGDVRYVLPIPDEVIELSGMEQNER